MKKDIKTPSVGESITEVSILKWNKQNGQLVKSGEQILEIESDKATVEVVAEHTGVLQIGVQAGERVGIGAVIGFIDDSLSPSTTASAPPPVPTSKTPQQPPIFSSPPPSPIVSSHTSAHSSLSPSVRRASAQLGVNPSQIAGSGKDGRVTKGDVLNAASSASVPPPAPQLSQQASKPPVQQAPQYVDKPGDRRVPMSMLRQKIAERLVHAQHTAAILTTFNEVDMTAVNKIRAEHKEAFKAKHGVNLSFMSFFTKASIAALKMIPEVNATIDGKDIVYHDYYDVGIAVGTERGLVVPVIREADKLDFAGLEKRLGELAIKARDGKLTMSDLSGGTFTISNGGTYGSLMSTPILNPPQSGILGMHKIMDRPMVVNGKIEARPMMYLALSYDHRIIDGKGAVTFLVQLKDHLENPEKLGFSY